MKPPPSNPVRNELLFNIGCFVWYILETHWWKQSVIQGWVSFFYCQYNWIQGVYYSPLCTGSIIYRMGRQPESDKHAHASGLFTFGKLNVGCLLDRAYGMQSDWRWAVGPVVNYSAAWRLLQCWFLHGRFNLFIFVDSHWEVLLLYYITSTGNYCEM